MQIRDHLHAVCGGELDAEEHPPHRLERAVHHGLRGAARWSWFLSCQDGQQVCETRIVEIVNIVTW